MGDTDLNKDDDLTIFENLTDDERRELFEAELCGLPLEVCLENFPDPAQRREFLGSCAMIKIGTAAREALESGELLGPEDRAELAILLLDVVTLTAKEAGVHRHKLASGLRGLARTISL
jgi:hypothetical protein